MGVGNVLAVALLMGGPGAIFWILGRCLVSMSTAFFGRLHQIFKVRSADGTFRGGPAYYIARGMKNKVLASIFAVIRL